MREHDHAAPPDDGGHQGSYTTPDQTTVASNVNVTPAQSAPVTKVGPTREDVKARHRSALSSPLTWLSLATLLLGAIIYLFLAPIPAATQDFGADTPQKIPTDP